MKLLELILSLLKIDNIFKKKPYCIWIYTFENNKPTWICLNPGGNSFYRCKKAISVLTNSEFPLKRYVILPKGIMPYK